MKRYASATLLGLLLPAQFLTANAQQQQPRHQQQQQIPQAPYSQTPNYQPVQTPYYQPMPTPNYQPVQTPYYQPMPTPYYQPMPTPYYQQPVPPQYYQQVPPQYYQQQPYIQVPVQLPGNGGSGGYGNICYGNGLAGALPQYAPVGTMCWINTGDGNVQGQVGQ